MCRSDHDAGGARRCPCDTSEARRLRGYNKRDRTAYAGLAVKPAEPRLLKELEADAAEPFTVESVKQDIQRLRKMSGHSSIWTFGDSAEADALMNKIGTGVEYLAESKHGAPTDTRLRDCINADRDARIAEREAAQLAHFKARESQDHRYAELCATGINDYTHPSIIKRHTAWEEEQPEKYAAWLQAKQDTEETYNKLNATGVKTTVINPEIAELYTKRNTALRAALKEVGVQFADPDSLEVSDDSHKDAVKSLKQALAFYPQEWVDNSNKVHLSPNYAELRIKRSVGRAHYNRNKAQQSVVNIQTLHFATKPESWTPDPFLESESEYVALDEDNGWVDPETGKKYTSWDRPEGYRGWVILSYKYSDTPVNSTWEKVTFKEQKYNPETQSYEFTGNMVDKYRTPHKTRRKEASSYKAEITISKDGSTSPLSQNSGFRVALHEFAHRVEDTTPAVRHYEQAFLSRRAGLRSDTPEQLTAIHGRSKERGYKDNFTNHYMGRVYESGSRELLSMGMEAVFSGTEGGLVGAGDHKADADYKRFILGMLASSAKTKPAE
jgi:hypothetical protein